ncbi:hypothetical protein [Desulfovibrio ferrophilus]|uniref:Uncharacterized protein n=1 Tax=Desulfovibrio ferrophilus TaxID=241368 RepID=A0A2Z6B252_9BACT|nr:hypothetical protein [Desulfovibrio ferrophilus]BBD09486.1 uncharacterized protein DFE_2760 [Desulfovibrio ferrophilus]
MSKWIRSKLPEFVRDVLRDFCLVSRLLEHEFRHFDRTGHVDFNALKNLLGQEMNKGLLWRLKDTAHVLYKNDSASGASGSGMLGQFLDWSVGYIFHDAMKLKEDAYQQQNYAPWFRQLQDKELSGEHLAFSRELFGVLDQTNESIQREVNRIRFLLFNCRKLFMDYLPLHRENELLARFLFDQNDLVREVFGDSYAKLVANVYDEAPERLSLLAARSLRRGGWAEEAARALAEAERISPESQEVLQEKQRHGLA